MKQLVELLSPQDLADYLDVPVSTLYDWRWRGEGPKGFRVALGSVEGRVALSARAFCSPQHGQTKPRPMA